MSHRVKVSNRLYLWPNWLPRNSLYEKNNRYFWERVQFIFNHTADRKKKKKTRSKFPTLANAAFLTAINPRSRQRRPFVTNQSSTMPSRNQRRIQNSAIFVANRYDTNEQRWLMRASKPLIRMCPTLCSRKWCLATDQTIPPCQTSRLNAETPEVIPCRTLTETAPNTRTYSLPNSNMAQ